MSHCVHGDGVEGSVRGLVVADGDIGAEIAFEVEVVEDCCIGCGGGSGRCEGGLVVELWLCVGGH